MAGRFVAVAGGIVLAAGVGAFVAERAGWFDTPGWPDALPGLGSGGTSPPLEGAGEPAPAPRRRARRSKSLPGRTASPPRTPQPPGRKPDGLDAQDAASAEQTAQAQSADQSPERSAGQTGEQPAAAAADPATSAPSGPATDTTDTDTADETPSHGRTARRDARPGDPRPRSDTGIDAGPASARRRRRRYPGARHSQPVGRRRGRPVKRPDDRRHAGRPGSSGERGGRGRARPLGGHARSPCPRASAMTGRRWRPRSPRSRSLRSRVSTSCASSATARL